VICPACNGTGVNRHNGWDCEHCDGRGWQTLGELMTPFVVVCVLLGTFFTLARWVWHLFANR
jgi:hypothetical protein